MVTKHTGSDENVASSGDFKQAEHVNSTASLVGHINLIISIRSGGPTFASAQSPTSSNGPDVRTPGPEGSVHSSSGESTINTFIAVTLIDCSILSSSELTSSD